MLKKLENKNKALLQEFENNKEEILKEPFQGKALKKDLVGYRCWDWTYNGVGLRICYKVINGHTYFVYYGTRENFYQELKRYLL